MLEFKRRVLEFKLDGLTHKVNYPTVNQIQVYEKESKENSDNQAEILIKLLATLGLDENVCRGLEVPHFEAIIQELTTVKK